MEDLLTSKAEITLLESRFKWLLAPVHEAYKNVEHSLFFSWLDQITCPEELFPAASQLFYHSHNFPKVIGLMLAMTGQGEWGAYKLLGEHIYEEATHSELLLDWMIKFRMISERDDIFQYHPNPETSNCINLGYQLAMERDLAGWIVSINSAIEYCAYRFFKEVARKMNALQAGDTYFDIHVAADEHHAVMGLKQIEAMVRSDTDKLRLVRQAVNAVSLWHNMINSWVVHHYRQ